MEALALEIASQSGLIKVEVENAAYKEQIEDVNSGRPQSQRVKAASIFQCLKPRLLHNHCLVGRIKNARATEQAKYEAIKSQFDTRLASNIANLSDLVGEVLAKVKHNHMHRNPS